MAGGYDMMPWKLVFCKENLNEHRECPSGQYPSIWLDEIPDPPEPGRVPHGCDHLHVAVKYSADQRMARPLELWKALTLATARCEHGRAQCDSCLKCPDGWVPDMSGRRIGTNTRGRPVVIPPREHWNDPTAWVQ